MLSEAQSVPRLSTGKLALFIILASESVFFATLLAAYVALRGQGGWSVEHTFARLQVPLLNTSILLLSTLSAWRGAGAIRAGKVSVLQGWLAVTLLLGLIFVVGQAYEFSHAGLHIDDQAFGGVFFTLMGFHALHVLGGGFFLLLVFIRSRMGDFSASRHDVVELATWFWYYVAAVWIVLFAALYIL